MESMPERPEEESLRGVDVFCPCTNLFRVPKSMKGGLANCPQCGKAVPVPGGPEILFWLLLSGGIAAVLGVAAVLYHFSGVPAAVGALVMGGIIIAVIVLAS